MCINKRKVSVILIITLFISSLTLLNQQKVYAVQDTEVRGIAYGANINKSVGKLHNKKIDVSEIFFWDKFFVINLGKSIEVDYEICPSKANNNTKIIWVTNNKNVVEVKDGVITGVGEGEAIVTAKTIKGDVKQECKVRVVDCVELPSKSFVPQDKIWTLKFNKKVLFDEITSENIYIVDKNGDKVDIIIKKFNETSISIAPKNNYNECETYNLLIKGVKSTGKKELEKTIRMEFTIDGDSFIVGPIE